MKHSPGPWKARGQSVSGPFGVTVAWFGEAGRYGINGSYSIGKREAEANAKLCAAAPTMLAMLVEIKAALAERLGTNAQEWAAVNAARDLIDELTGGST